MKKITIQITSGKGPAECCRVVACVQELMMKKALLVQQVEQLAEQHSNQWQHHQDLERGDPVKIIKRSLF